MFFDKQIAIRITKNLVHHNKMKHIEIDRHFISKNVTNMIVQLTHIPIRLHIADILTKALPRTSFEEFSFKLDLYNMYNPT